MEYASLHTLRSRSGIEGGGPVGQQDSTPIDSPRERPGSIMLVLRRSWGVCKKNPKPMAIGALVLFFLFVVVSIASGHMRQTSEYYGRNTKPCLNGQRPMSEPPRPFIYMYDFGSKFTHDIRNVTPAFYSDVYDAEKLVYDFFNSTKAVRTMKPESATLFYVPFFSAYYTLSRYHDWKVNMKDAVNATSQVWQQVLRRVRSEFPYFNRTRGADHFSVLSMDHGRCTALTYLDPFEYGEMFFLQHNGDKSIRSSHAHPKRNLQVVAYNYGSPPAVDIPDIPCYRPERDIVIPPPVEGHSNGAMLPSSPLATERSTTTLFMFSPHHHHGSPVLHFGRDIRSDLHTLFRGKGLKGWVFGANENEELMRQQMRKSIFCVCPPGHSQWTSRFVKAILAGCIPVTFFREHDNPWQSELEYESISVNVDPTELEALEDRLTSVLRNPRRLLGMQKAIAQIQANFQWDDPSAVGVKQLIAHTLWCRSKDVQRGPAGRAQRLGLNGRA